MASLLEQVRKLVEARMIPEPRLVQVIIELDGVHDESGVRSALDGGS